MNTTKKMMDPGEKTHSNDRYNRDVFFKKNIGCLSKICVCEKVASGKNWQCGAVAKKGEKNDTDFLL